MQVVIYGATGTIGSNLVQEALAAGHKVRGVARRPDRSEIIHERLEMAAGNVLSPDDVARTIAGADAVLVAVGSPKITGTLRSEGTRNIVDAMNAAGIRRLVCQTSLGTGDSWSNLNLFWKVVMFGILLRRIHHDTEVQERIVRESGLDWTIVRPAAFVDEPLGPVRHGFGPRIRDLKLKVARSDVARFMVQQIKDFGYLHQTPGLSY